MSYTQVVEITEEQALQEFDRDFEYEEVVRSLQRRWRPMLRRFLRKLGEVPLVILIPLMFAISCIPILATRWRSGTSSTPSQTTQSDCEFGKPEPENTCFL